MHPYTIFVTNLFDLPLHYREYHPVQVVSIIQPELQPDDLEGLAAPNHLRIGVHDIVEHDRYGVLAGAADVEQLIDFIERWQPERGALMTHCYAGVSRSTAAALIAAYVKSGDAEASGRALRAAAPHAQPNRHIVALADEVLGSAGEMLRAHRSMGPATQSVVSGPLTTLKLS